MRYLSGPFPSIVDSRRYKWWAYVSIAVGLLVVVMDQSGMNIAMPKVAEEFDADIPTVQWVTLSYILSISALLMPLGRLADILGRRRVYLAGFLVFIGGAIVGGTAPSFPVLLVAKIVQGIGSAGVQANGLAIVTESFPERERGKALGLYTSVVGGGLIMGPAVGGVLISAFDWRAVFYASIIAGFGAWGVAHASLLGSQNSGADQPKRLNFDWGGAVLSSGMLATFLLGLSNSHRLGWGSAPVVTSLLAAAALFLLFIWWQRRTSDPMLDLGLFRSKNFSLGVSTRFIQFLANSAVIFLMPFYLIQVLDFEPNRAGLMVMPYAFGMGLTSPFSGRISDRYGTRWISVVGMGFSASSLFIFSQLTPDSSTTHVIIGMLLGGMGMGTFSSANSAAIMGSQSREKYSIVAAFQNLIRNSANVTGVALATTIVSFTMGDYGYEPSLASVADSEDIGVRVAFVAGLNRAFMISGGLMVLGLVLSSLHGHQRKEMERPDQPIARPAASPPVATKH